MKSQGTTEATVASSAKVWKYILGAAIAYPILLLFWVIFDFRVLHPELANVDVETTMDKIRWFGVPLLMIAALFGAKWVNSVSSPSARELESQAKALQLKEQETALHGSEKARREYVLEVLGLGVTYEKYRQGKLWSILQQGGPYTSIRETDPKKYPWADTDKLGQSGGRACDALENGAKASPMYWGVPSFYAGAPIANPDDQPSDTNPMPGLAAAAETTGMAWHLFVTGPWQLSERPDQLLEQVFAFFDAHSDLPYVVLLAGDSSATRDAGLPLDAPRIVEDGYYIPDMPDSTTVFVLARRERVEPLRPFLWADLENDYLQENLRRMYYQLRNTVPNSRKVPGWEGKIPRLPTVAEWLQAAAAFARDPYYKPGPKDDPPGRWRNDPPKDWHPTPWFPVPWNREQMKTFDNLPSLGFIHRPVFVKFEDEHGKPVERHNAREKILETAWQQALQTLPETERAKGPARIVAAFGKHVEQQIALEGVLHQYTASGGPEIDTGKTAQFINTDRRLGNTGAATFFVQMALGVMGSYIDGGTSAAINMRDPSGASIVFISPPREERRKAQEGQDVFKHRVQPSIDLQNYKVPTAGEVVGAGNEAIAHVADNMHY